MTTPEALVYLASLSPRRQELLQQIGVHYEVLPVDVDETPAAGESAEDYVQRLALAKAGAGWSARSRSLKSIQMVFNSVY